MAPLRALAALAVLVGARALRLKPQRVVVRLVNAATGGPEALLQLLIACADAGADCYWTGDMPTKFALDYRAQLGAHRLEGKKLGQEELTRSDLVIVPEIYRCYRWKNITPFIYLLAQTNMAKDSCKRLAHNHHIAKVAQVSRDRTLTPYISPLVVANAQRSAGLVPATGEFEDLAALQRLKEPCLLLLDSDAKLPGPPPPSCEVRTAVNLAKKELLALMLRARVVVDTCMRGTERVPLEAGLHGAVVVTDNCQTGKDEVDVPLTPRHKGDVSQAVALAVEDWAREVQDPGQLALRRRYALEVGRESMAKEFGHFLAAEAP